MYLVLSATPFTCIKGVCKDGPQSQEDDSEDEERPGVGAGVHGEDQWRTGEEEAPSSHIFCAPATTRSPHTHGALDILLYYPDIFSYFFLQLMQSWAAVRSQTPDVSQSFNICNSPNFKLFKTLLWKKSPETDDCLKHFVMPDTTGRTQSVGWWCWIKCT